MLYNLALSDLLSQLEYSMFLVYRTMSIFYTDTRYTYALQNWSGILWLQIQSYPQHMCALSFSLLQIKNPSKPIALNGSCYIVYPSSVKSGCR